MSDLISIDYTHHESLTTDLIRRQDAIECCSCLHPEDCWAEIEALPSATSQNLTKPNKTYEYDLISRAELDRLLVVARDDGYITKYEYDLFRELVGRVPSTEAVQGEWIQKDMCADRFCSCCDYAVWDSEAEEYNYCPNCGAKMYKGGDAE